LGAFFNLQVAAKHLPQCARIELEVAQFLAGRKVRQWDQVLHFLDDTFLRREVKRWVGWTRFPPTWANLRHWRATKAFEREFMQDIRLLNGKLLGGFADPVRDRGIRYTFSREMEPFRAEIVQQMERLLDSARLKRMFGRSAAGRDSYKKATDEIRGRINQLLEFEDIQRFPKQ